MAADRTRNASIMAELVRDPALWRAINPHLSIDAVHSRLPRSIGEEQIDGARRQLAYDGYFAIPALLSDDLVARAREGTANLVRQGWPAVFAFLYDETWLLFDELSRLIGGLLGQDYRRLGAFWAWSVGAGGEPAGWGPHRDRSTTTVSESGEPDVLTLWLALTNATPESGCIYVVPASRDPCYRVGLENVEVRDLQDVRAVPATAGTVLGWTHHLLHWGARASALVSAPRVSLSAEFQRARCPLLDDAIDAGVPTFDERAQLLGRNVLRYAHMRAPSKMLGEIAERLESGAPR
jgi:hypothetical protein